MPATGEMRADRRASRGAASYGQWTAVAVGAGARQCVLTLLLVFVTSWVALAAVTTESLVPPAWPASGLAVGALLTTTRWWRGSTVTALVALVVAAHLLHGVTPGMSIAYSTAYVVEALVVRWFLCRGTSGRRPALLDTGDVSRLVGAITLGSAVAATGFATIDWLSGAGSPLLGAVAVFGTHAASLMVLTPLFLETPSFPPLAAARERGTQWGLAVVTTVAILVSSDAPPMVFVVMPMFAWLGFRGSLREAIYLLAVVGVVSTALTTYGIGPVAGLADRYLLADELVIGYLQLFLLDCGLILLPLSVSVARQRLSAAQAASGREALDRVIASATGTGIIATDQYGRIVLFNPGAEAMLGYGIDEMLGQLPDRFHPSEELSRHASELGCGDTFLEICVAVSESGTPRRLWQFVRKEGQERTMLMTIAAMPDQHHEVTGFLCTAEDVTERELAQAALGEALDHQATAVSRLRELDQIKTDLIATVSHELRTPITSIVGFTELLDDGAAGDLSEAQRDLVGRVDRNSRRLLVLIEDLLTLSHVESAGLGIEPVPCDLRLAVSGAYDAVAPSLAGRVLQVRLDLPDQPVHCLGDLAQLERMTLNLLTNAIKFTPDHGVVEVSVATQGELVRLVVRDTGYGIPEAEQDQLFTRFFRASTASQRAIPGTGLGLSIVEAVVRAHGGTVDIQSAVGEGTAVAVTIASGGPRRE